MLILIAGILIFMVAHGAPQVTALHGRMISALGPRGYRMTAALLSLAGLALIVLGFATYRASGWVQVWQPPAALRHLALLLMLPVFVLLSAAYLPGKIKALAKHPMLLSVKLWALAHLLANGDLGGIILFASFLVWAVSARISAKRRALPVMAPSPFVRNDAIALGAGLALYVAFVIYLHPLLIGVRILP